MSSRSSTRDTKDPERSYGQEAFNTGAFADLPVETMLHIVLLLPIPSVISLRLCCKTLATMSHERMIWMAAARRLCTDYHAFGCSYQFEDMTSLDLENLATAPFRFSARLRTEFVAKALQPILTRSVVSPMPSILDGFRYAKLVPGGRFLLTCTYHGVLQLWDLGLTPNTSPSSQPRATTVVADWMTHSNILVQSPSDQSGILVLMMLIPTHLSRQIQFNIYEVLPLSISPTFHLLSSFRCQYSIYISSASFLSDFFLFQDETKVLVWNYHENTYNLWYNRRDSNSIFLVDDNIVLTGGGDFYVYKMPELRPYIPDTEAIFEFEPPMLCEIRQDETFAYRRAYVCHTNPHNHSFPGPHRCLDVVGDNGDNVQTLACFGIPADFFSVEKAHHFGNNDPRRLVPVLIQAVEDYNLTRFIRWISSWCNNNRLVHNMLVDRIAGRSTVKAHFTTMDNNPTSGHWGILWESDANEVPECYDICLISGRICIITSDEIRIMEYLKPLV